MNITLRKTGHIYYGKEMEALEDSSNCETCNDENCDTCKDKFEVTGIFEKKSFDSNELAIEYYLQCENDFLSLTFGINTVDFSIDPDTSDLFIRNDELYIQYFNSIKQFTQECVCCKDTEIYQREFNRIKVLADKWKECKCTDKADASYNDGCQYYHHCIDKSCYFEMKHRGRTKKKQYM